jgi:ribosomal protein S26
MRTGIGLMTCAGSRDYPVLSISKLQVKSQVSCNMTGMVVQQHKVMQAQTIFSWIFQSYLCALKKKAVGFHSVIFATLRRVVYCILCWIFCYNRFCTYSTTYS